MAAAAAPTTFKTLEWDVGTYKVIVSSSFNKKFLISLYENGAKIEGQELSSIHAVFQRCVYRKQENSIHSRLFISDDPTNNRALLISVDTAAKKIYAAGMSNFLTHKLLLQYPTIQCAEGQAPTVAWIDRPQAIDQLDPSAGNGLRNKDAYIAPIASELLSRTGKVLMAVAAVKAFQEIFYRLLEMSTTEVILLASAVQIADAINPDYRINEKIEEIGLRIVNYIRGVIWAPA